MRRLFSSAIAVFVGVVVFAAAPEGQERPAAGGRAPVSLPEGPGKEEVSTTCAACHGLNMITGAAGYTQSGWRDLIGTMVTLPDGARDRRQPVPRRHTFRRSRDARRSSCPATSRSPSRNGGADARPAVARSAPAADGTIWWNGQFISLVGRLNPTTGEMKEFTLDPTSKPHSIVDDAEGNIWYTGNGNGTIGKLDPGDRRDHRLTDAGSRRPRSAHRDLRQERHDVLHAAAEQHARPPGAVDRRDQARDADDAARAALRPQAGLEGHDLGGLQRHRQARQHESGDDGGARISAAGPGIALAPARDHQRRHDLVRQFVARPARPTESEDRRGQGMAVAERRRRRTRTRSKSSTTSSGTTNRASGPTRWSASIRRPRTSRAGRFPPASASSATCARRRTAT